LRPAFFVMTLDKAVPEMETFEAWYDAADSSVGLTYSSEVQRMKAIGRWLKQPVLLHRFQASSLEEAVSLHQGKMDWDNFWKVKALIDTCPACGVSYFPLRSASCPNCESAS